jgi:flagellar export protein FliJ
MGDLRRLKERLEALRGDIAREGETLHEWEQKLDEARRAWSETRKASKVLERLKERELRAFVKNAEKAEAALLDEIALRPFVLKSAADT